MDLLTQTKTMTKDELLANFSKDLTKSMVEEKFKRAQEKMHKKGYELTKVKVANEWQYTVTTMNTTEKNEYSIITMEQLEMYQNYEFGIFLLLSAMPMRVFIGSYKDFFNMIYLNYTKSNKEAFKTSLDRLEKDKIIFYKIDPTNEERIMIAFTSFAEKCLSIEVKNYVIQKSAEIAKKYKNHDFFSIIKVWIGVCYCNRQGEDLITLGKLEEMTGLSKYQISKALKILFKEDKIENFGLKYSFNEVTGDIRCKGREMGINDITTEESVNKNKKNIIIRTA